MERDVPPPQWERSRELAFLVCLTHNRQKCKRPRQHSIGYMGDGFYRSKDPTNSIKVLKEMLQKTNQTTKTTKYSYDMHRQ